MFDRRQFLQSGLGLLASMGIRLDAQAISAAGASIDLSRFCDPEPVVYGLDQPWTFRGFTYASNTRIAVRVPTVQPDNVSPVNGNLFRVGTGGRVPHAEYLLWDVCEAADEPWPAVELVDGLTDCPRHIDTMRECERCDGKGHLYDGETCYRCDGSGHLLQSLCAFCNGHHEVITPCLQLVGSLRIREEYDALIRALPNVRWAEIASAEQISFRFDGGEGLVTSTAQPDEPRMAGVRRVPRILCRAQ
jgi:hypothetical protein